MSGAEANNVTVEQRDRSLELVDELKKALESDIGAIEDPTYIEALATISMRNQLEYDRIVKDIIASTKAATGKKLNKTSIDDAVKQFVSDIFEDGITGNGTADNKGRAYAKTQYDKDDPRSCIAFDKYDHPHKIKVPDAADWVIRTNPIATLVGSKETLYYYQGAYRPYGDQMIEQVLDQAFGNLTNYNDNVLLKSDVQAAITRRITARTYVEPTDFDKDLDLINLENLLYNWRTGELKDHTHEYRSRIQIPIKYDPTKECPNIDEFLKKKVSPRDLPKIYEFAGYCFYRKYDKLQKIMLLVGPGSTYKSTLIDVIVDVCGLENTSSVTLDELGGKNFDKFATSQLYGKLFNNAADLSGNPIYYTGTFKKLTSGKDLITAEFKNQQKFQFVNTAKIGFSTNIVPPTFDKTSGFYRRFEPIMMKDTTPLDDELMKALKSPDELSGLFNRAVGTLPELLERGTFTNQYTLGEVTDMYQRMSEPVSTFARLCIQESAGDYISKEDMYQTYVKFCDMNGVEPLDIGPFGKKLREVMDWSNSNAQQKSYGGKPRVWCWVDVKVYDPAVKAAW